jgi:GT2 family glycosyltransferase
MGKTEDMMDSVTAILVNYNTGKYAIRAVSDLLDKNRDVRLSVVIVDSKSSDHDLALIRDSGILQNDKVVLHCLKKNYGFARANNEGMDLAKSLFEPEFYLISNTDIEIEAHGIISGLIEGLRPNPQLAFAQPLVFNVHQRTRKEWQIQLRRVERFSDTLICNSPILRLFFHKRNFAYSYMGSRPYTEQLEGEVPSGAFFLVRSDIMELVGRFDPRTFLYHEEIILGLKFKKAGYCGALFPRYCIRHLQGASIKSNIKKKFNSAIYAYKIISQIFYLREYLHIGKARLAVFFFIRIIELVFLCITLERSPRKLITSLGILHHDK